jgi:squalene-associated FAD-dependent desaturase
VSNPKKIAIIGAGWAGTASALALHKKGHFVTAFDSSRLLGGRARGVSDPVFGMLDNGQHLLLGAYQETLKLIALLNPDTPTHQLLKRSPLYLMSASGHIHLKASKFLSPPTSTLFALLTTKGLCWADKFSMIRLMVKLSASKPKSKLIAQASQNKQASERHDSPQNLTVLLWLLQQKQSQYLINTIWQPLCLATLNTPVETACAQLFKNVLRDSLGSAMAGATDMILPKTDLSTLAPQRLVELLDCRLGHTVREIVCHENNIEIDGEQFDGCVIATPPLNTLRLIKNCLKHTESYEKLTCQLKQFTYAPITTCYMRLEQPFELPAPMLMLHECPSKGHIGQWVFERQMQTESGQSTDLAVIISDSSAQLENAKEWAHPLTNEANASVTHEVLAQSLHQQIAKQLMQSPSYANQPLPALRDFRVITDKRATFVAKPGLDRPTNVTGDARVMLAGDWTDTGYPSVIEGAVCSGLQAAKGFI